MHDHETLFRAQVEAHLADSLAFVDRLEDSMWARIILAWHSMRHGRFMAVRHNFVQCVLPIHIPLLDLGT